MSEETKHITARLQVLEYLMTQANLADLFRHTDILLFVMYAQNVAEGVTTQYKRMSEHLDINFYVSFPFDEWMRKIQNWKEKLHKPEFHLEYDTAIGEGRGIRLRGLMEKLCDKNTEVREDALEEPYKTIARKPYHEAIVELETALDSLKTNLSNLAMLPLKANKDFRSAALRTYLDKAAEKESVKAELQEYTFFCGNKRNGTLVKHIIYLKQRIQALVGKDELADLDLSENEQQELLAGLRNIFSENEIHPAPSQIPAKAQPWANDELFAKVLSFVDVNAGMRFPVLDLDSVVDFLVRKDVTLSDGEEEHIQSLLVLMESMSLQFETLLQAKQKRTANHSDELQQRIRKVLNKVETYNTRLSSCMASGKNVGDLNKLFQMWFSSELDASMKKPQESLLRLLEDGLDNIKMETYVHLLREAWTLGLLKNEKPVSDKIYQALSKMEDGEDEFPISGPSFNKYFRNPDFMKEEKWSEAAKLLAAVRKTLNFES